MTTKLSKKFEIFCKDEVKCPFPGSKNLEKNYCRKFCNIHKFLEFLERENYKIVHNEAVTSKRLGKGQENE